MITAPLGLKLRMLKAEVTEISAVLVCDVDPQREALRQAPNGAPPSPPASCVPPTTYQPHHRLVREGCQDDTMRERRRDHP